ncbi:hypothetical protein [Trinickia dinghuensis]|uniref:Uncharacterized protein n=1 Tax=Trinickia dinghuensis TaxID=2291023 RepID=A0A3D8JVI2_9BURK|nr:hypothetical protein [Trinickia dinghuensis]RDU96735.1 hypothetical protein DWV00_22335 [Trinickia dinghuensis]
MKIGTESGIGNDGPDLDNRPSSLPPRPGTGALERTPSERRMDSEASRARRRLSEDSTLSGLTSLHSGSGAHFDARARAAVKVAAGTGGAARTESTEGIRHALLDAAESKDGRVLVVTHSPVEPRSVRPTERSARDKAASDGLPDLLTVVDQAAREGALKAGSVVLLHLPASWFREPQRARLGHLLDSLRQRQVKAVVAQVDESIYGDLGGRPQAHVLKSYRLGDAVPTRAANSDAQAALPNAPSVPRPDPKRATPLGRNRVHDVTHCAMPTTADSLADIPVLSTGVLMGSLRKLIGPEAMRGRVGFLSDDEAYMRGSARQYEVTHRLYFDRARRKLVSDTATSKEEASAEVELAPWLSGMRG